MSDFEKYFTENRAHFDSEEPAEGHFSRFEKRLGEKSSSRHFNFRHALQIAASVAVILASAWVIIDKSNGGKKIASSEIPADVVEAEDYYTRMVNEKYRQIEGFTFDSEQDKAVLLEELRDLDVYQQKLVSDLEANPSDERVINAMIRHYQLKLEIMDQIITQLNQIKNQNSDKNEKESV